MDFDTVVAAILSSLAFLGVGGGVSFLACRFARKRIERDLVTAEIVASDARELLPTPGGAERLASRLHEVGGTVATAVRELMSRRVQESEKAIHLAREMARASGRGWRIGLGVFCGFFASFGPMLLVVGVMGLDFYILLFGLVLMGVAVESGFALSRLVLAHRDWERRLCECLISIDEALRKEGL